MDSKLPLLSLFIKLRQKGLNLSADDYQMLLEVISEPSQTGFNLQDRSSIIQLCRYLWVKSPEQERLFEACLEQMILQPLASRLKIKSGKKSDLQADSQAEVATSKADLDDDSSSQTSEPTPDSSSEIQVVKSIRRIAKPDDNYDRFKVSGTYLPASREQMWQSWLALHRPLTTGVPTEIDIDATLADVKKKGMFFDLIIVPRNYPSTEILLLIDQQGSMVPFHGLARQLLETVVQGGHLGKIDCYYFENYPVGEVYLDTECWKGRSLVKVLSQLNPERTAILIFSDAGAARGRWNLTRIEETIAFLRKIKPYCRALVWLNPLPKKRWQKTTAEAIAKRVEMFECHHRGVSEAIAKLRS